VTESNQTSVILTGAKKPPFARSSLRQQFY
jgi:hypothetical protein